MADILLEDWAKQNNVSHRTAQGWAKTKKVSARLTRQKVVMERIVKKYVIDENATVPE